MFPVHHLRLLHSPYFFWGGLIFLSFGGKKRKCTELYLFALAFAGCSFILRLSFLSISHFSYLLRFLMFCLYHFHLIIGIFLFFWGERAFIPITFPLLYILHLFVLTSLCGIAFNHMLSAYFLVIIFLFFSFSFLDLAIANFTCTICFPLSCSFVVSHFSPLTVNYLLCQVFFSFVIIAASRNFTFQINFLSPFSPILSSLSFPFFSFSSRLLYLLLFFLIDSLFFNFLYLMSYVLTLYISYPFLYVSPFFNAHLFLLQFHPFTLIPLLLFPPLSL